MSIEKRSYPLVSPLSLGAGLAGALLARYSETPHPGMTELARFIGVFVAGWTVVVGIRWAVAHRGERRDA